MSPELSIKLDYLEKRRNPAEVFEAMALYINAYKDLGQLLINSIGLQDDFDFQLNNIIHGSILSKLASIPGTISSKFENALYSSGHRLFTELIEISETNTEEQVDSLATTLESALLINLPQQIAAPYIDRQNLAQVLSKFSIANQKIQPGEKLSLDSNTTEENPCLVNTDWRFTGNPKEMFLGETEPYKHRDKLYVTISVNEGNSVWAFRSISNDKKFNARITDKAWLERYQSGLSPAIGPRDIIEAEITYDIYTPPKGKGQPRIRNATIEKIVTIHRNNEHQYEL
jgi:hypothetical protein